MNIMINNYCNLDCSYCFAHLGLEPRVNISDENMETYVNFLKKSNYPDLRILGGEPTLHPNFEKYVLLATLDPFFREVLIFTNALSLTKELSNSIVSHKSGFLINYNHPKMLGEVRHKKTVQNISDLVEAFRRKNLEPKITLGINIFEPNFDYQYIIDTAVQLNLPVIRYSITVPTELGKETSLDYYRQYIPQLMNFLDDCYKNGIRTTIDCNNIPKCLYTPEQLMNITQSCHDLCGKNFCCMPMDVRPNLETTRCFPFFDDYHVNLKDFNNYRELVEYFGRRIDSKRFETPTFKECVDCRWFKEQKCQGTCLTYKFKKC